MPSINLGIISSRLQQRLYFHLYFYSQSPCCDPSAMCMPWGGGGERKVSEFENMLNVEIKAMLNLSAMLNLICPIFKST